MSERIRYIVKEFVYADDVGRHKRLEEALNALPKEIKALGRPSISSRTYVEEGVEDIVGCGDPSHERRKVIYTAVWRQVIRR